MKAVTKQFNFPVVYVYIYSTGVFSALNPMVNIIFNVKAFLVHHAIAYDIANSLMSLV